MMQGNKNPFKGRQFMAEIILWAIRWYLQFPISYRDLERMLSDRGVHVDHTTLFRWLQAYAPELDKRIRPHLRMTQGSWRVDETYIRVKGECVYLCRAVDAVGQTIDFLLSPKRDAAAARRFFQKALKQAHTVNPHDHGRQECSLSYRDKGYEGRWRALAFCQAPTGEGLE
jgi:transposase-like protein